MTADRFQVDTDQLRSAAARLAEIGDRLGHPVTDGRPGATATPAIRPAAPSGAATPNGTDDRSTGSATDAPGRPTGSADETTRRPDSAAATAERPTGTTADATDQPATVTAGATDRAAGAATDPARLLDDAGLEGWSVGSALARLHADWDACLVGLAANYADHADQLRAAADRYDATERSIDRVLRDGSATW